MDDSCVVCAEPMEWVAYGACGHRDVCSTCVVRLRFILDDRVCCICKSDCPSVFVTKAMGEYTQVIADFSVLPPGANEGKVGPYWYHQDTQAYFDDEDQYKMIRAMCRLSCSVCDNTVQEQGVQPAARRRNRFQRIEQLKGHLHHQHWLYMCSLCLEGRKVFICEQKLYTKSQLQQHMRTGDSEVDGSEIERNGFSGHPKCEFCRSSFYGENELYMHMERDHEHCHICRRLRPGQYDYFKNYEELEMHFRHDHFLCEDEVCLANKFVVFQDETELKRHNALVHGGNMRRAERNAALRIPVIIQYRRSVQESHRGRGGRGHHFRRNVSNDQQSSFTRDSFLTAEHGTSSQADVVTDSVQSLNMGASSERSAQSQSSRNGRVLEQSFFPALSDQDFPEARTASILEQSSFPALSDREPSRYAQALGQKARGTNLGNESFPPLPGMTNRTITSTQNGLQTLAKNTLASRLQQRSKGSVKVVHRAHPRPSENPELIPSNSSGSLHNWPTPDQGLLPSSLASQPRVAMQLTRENGFTPTFPGNSSWTEGSSSRMKHSISAPSLGEDRSSNRASSSMTSGNGRSQVAPLSSQESPVPKKILEANKSVVEKIRAALGMDAENFEAFKLISSQYRSNEISTSEYLYYAEQFGLSDLVPEMASILPDPKKQKELVDAYHTNLLFRSRQENGGSRISSSILSNQKKKGKGKDVGLAEASDTKDSLANNFVENVRKLQSNRKPSEGEAEVLSKEGYRVAKGMVQSSAGASLSKVVNGTESVSDDEPLPITTTAKQKSGKGVSIKQRKKMTKFMRSRLGEGSESAFLNLGSSNVSPERPERESTDKPPEEPQMGKPVRGAWRNGGGQRLFPKGPAK